MGLKLIFILSGTCLFADSLFQQSSSTEVKNKLKPISSHKDYSSIKIFQNLQRAFLLVSHGSFPETGGEEEGNFTITDKIFHKLN